MFEISEMAHQTNMVELASKTVYNVALNSEEKEIVAELDKFAREVGETGQDSDRVIAQFIQKTIEDRVEDYTNMILDAGFERGSIGEFDDVEYVGEPMNTLKAVKCAKEGNVPKSYLDPNVVKPHWVHRQVESQLSYLDLRRNGWKSIARITEYADRALQNAMFADIFGALDSVIVSGNPNYIAGGASLADADIRALISYLHDEANGETPIVVSRTNYISDISYLNPGMLTDTSKEEIRRTGFAGMYDGAELYRVSGTKTLGNGDPLFPAKRVFGLAGKVGNIDMRGDVRVYEDFDNQNEAVNLKITGFEYGYAFNDAVASKAAKIVLQ